MPPPWEAVCFGATGGGCRGQGGSRAGKIGGEGAPRGGEGAASGTRTGLQGGRAGGDTRAGDRRRTARRWADLYYIHLYFVSTCNLHRISFHGRASLPGSGGVPRHRRRVTSSGQPAAAPHLWPSGACPPPSPLAFPCPPRRLPRPAAPNSGAPPGPPSLPRCSPRSGHSRISTRPGATPRAPVSSGPRRLGGGEGFP